MSTMDRETALTVLRLDDNPDESRIVAAYARLTRRYPRNQFPERYERLLQAKERLLNPPLGFKEILFDAVAPPLAWLPSGEPSVEAEEEERLAYRLGCILRQAILKHREAQGPDDIGVNIERVMDMMMGGEMDEELLMGILGMIDD